MTPGEWYAQAVVVARMMPWWRRWSLARWDRAGRPTSDWPGFRRYIGPPPHEWGPR